MFALRGLRHHSGVLRPRCAWPLSSSSSSSSTSSMLLSQASRHFHASLSAASERKCTSDGLWVDESLPRPFNKVLIANRGEIACRVIRTCRHLGIKSVAVYSDADRDALHVSMADERYYIGESPAPQSYLVGEKLLDVAARSGAQAVHPGYGFLSENADFAAMCKAKGVRWIGPPEPAIISMGSKSASKQIMIDHNVPVVPGYHEPDQSNLLEEARRVGFPIMIKAILGGGGKGMRVCEKEEDFADMLDACKREAMKGFKDDNVLLERYITNPRHVEFQVFADQHGHAVHFHERDCSVQRRHQKVLEEAPSPGMTTELREAMGKSAVDAALAVGYEGAGTVEFILDADTNEYYFMEMNTRLQVEHPVTEMIMGRDLVQLQMHVAAGNKMPYDQATIDATMVGGHSIEARIYAENPENDFLPATGTLNHMSTPQVGQTTRVETGVREGDEVSIHYDPMISKLVVWGEDRTKALDLLDRQLNAMHIVGLPTNINFVKACAEHPKFIEGGVTTGFIEENFDELTPFVSTTPLPSHGHRVSAAFAIAGCLVRESAEARAFNAQFDEDTTSPMGFGDAHRINHTLSRKVELARLVRGEECSFEAVLGMDGTYQDCSSFSLTFPAVASDAAEATAFEVDVDSTGDFEYDPLESSISLTLALEDAQYSGKVIFDGLDVHVFLDSEIPIEQGVIGQEPARHVIFKRPHTSYGEDDGDARISAVAPMSGKIVKVLVASGDAVVKGDPLVIMEAMKMEHVVRAGQDGIIDRCLYDVEGFVEGGRPVVTFVEEE